jgi:hypothetical protein
VSASKHEALEKELRASIGQVTWADLRRHLVRDGIIIVAPELALLEAAVKIAENDQSKVAEWIQDGLLTKPNASQLEHWEKNLDLPFLSVVVQPFVLIQILN